MAKKRANLDRLGLLRKKLALEQELLNKNKSLAEKEEIEKEEEEIEEKEDEADVKIRQSYDAVSDLIQKSRENTQTEKRAQLVLGKTIEKKVKAYNDVYQSIRKEMAKVIVGQDETIKGLIRALIADGHVLIEGVPGIAKTTLIKTLARTMSCSFARIQFTPDLLPTDIIGISTYQEGRGFYTLKGPIFNNFILADEINRAPPKVQSALLEAMAERQATIAKESFPVPMPFFTMATQNPIENVGTYSLPEAQVDRFLFKLRMGYPTVDEEQKILSTNINVKQFMDFNINPVLSQDSILKWQEDAKQIYVDKRVERYIVRLIDATRFPKKYDIPLGKYVEYGASPRGSIGLITAGRAEAMLNEQTYVTPHNIKAVAYDVLRHRILLTYEAQAEGIQSEQIIEQILKKVPIP